MANEATVQANLKIAKGNLDYQSRPVSFQDDVAASSPTGPSPGSLAVTTGGVNVSFGELTTAGWCRFMNLDDTNFVEFGLWISSVFHPFLELPPGASEVVKISRNVGTVRGRADTATCECLVEAFEA